MFHGKVLGTGFLNQWRCLHGNTIFLGQLVLVRLLGKAKAVVLTEGSIHGVLLVRPEQLRCLLDLAESGKLSDRKGCGYSEFNFKFRLTKFRLPSAVLADKTSRTSVGCSSAADQQLVLTAAYSCSCTRG